MASRWLVPVLLLCAAAAARADGLGVLQEVAGTLDAQSNSWRRPLGGGTAAAFLGCDADLSGLSAGDCYYDAYAFGVESTDAIGIEVAATPPDLDLVLFLYCAFDPASPLAGGIIADDEDGPFPFGPAVLPADAVTLAPGNVYHLVVTTFVPGATGSYTITTTTDNVVPAAPVTWSAVKALYR